MQMLYDSDTFVVVHLQANEPGEGESLPNLPRHGFEIVDKRSNKEVYLDGAWADDRDSQWQTRTFREFAWRRCERGNRDSRRGLRLVAARRLASDTTGLV